MSHPALAESGASSAEYRALATRGTAVSIVLAVLVLLILVMMLFNPTF